jgi:hypothetical protein
VGWSHKRSSISMLCDATPGTPGCSESSRTTDRRSNAGNVAKPARGIVAAAGNWGRWLGLRRMPRLAWMRFSGQGRIRGSRQYQESDCRLAQGGELEGHFQRPESKNSGSSRLGLKWWRGWPTFPARTRPKPFRRLAGHRPGWKSSCPVEIRATRPPFNSPT